MKTTDSHKPCNKHMTAPGAALVVLVLLAATFWLPKALLAASGDETRSGLAQRAAATATPTVATPAATHPFDGWDSIDCGDDCQEGARLDVRLLSERRIHLGLEGTIPDNWDSLTIRQKIAVPGVVVTKRRVQGVLTDIPGFPSPFTPFNDIGVFVFEGRAYWNQEWLSKDRPRFFNSQSLIARDGPGSPHPLVQMLAPNEETVGDIGYKVTGFAGGADVTEATWIEVRDEYDDPLWVEPGSGELVGPLDTIARLADIPSITPSRVLKVRSGPGLEYPVIGTASAGSHRHLCARNSANTWLELCGERDQALWVPANDPAIASQVRSINAESLPAGRVPAVPAPLVQGTIDTGIDNLQQFLDICPQNDPAFETFSKDFVVRQDGVILTEIPCTEPVSAMAADEYTWALHSMQIVRAIYHMSQNSEGYLPWTTRSLYDWFVANVQGISLKTNFLYDQYDAYCCDVYGSRTYLTAPVEAHDNFQPAPEPGKIIDGVSLFLHEARHAYPQKTEHTYGCPAGPRLEHDGACDAQYDELNPGAYGVAYWLLSRVASGYLNVGIGCQQDKSSVVLWIRDSANWNRDRYVSHPPPVVMVRWPVGGPCLTP